MSEGDWSRWSCQPMKQSVHEANSSIRFEGAFFKGLRSSFGDSLHYWTSHCWTNLHYCPSPHSPDITTTNPSRKYPLRRVRKTHKHARYIWAYSFMFYGASLRILSFSCPAGATHTQAGLSTQLRLSQGQAASGSGRSKPPPSGRCRSRASFSQGGYYQQGSRNDQKNLLTWSRPFSAKYLPLLLLSALLQMLQLF